MLTVVTPPTVTALTTLAAAQRELGLAVGADTIGLSDLIAQASSACATWCGRPEGFGRATLRQTERLAAARDVLILDRDLVPAVSAVTEAGVALAGAGYELDGSLLYRLDGTDRILWPARTTVEITYQAGFDPIPADIERACLVVVQALYSARARDPMLRSESVDGVASYSYLDPRAGMEGLPPQAAALLAPWRRLSV